MGSRAFCFSIIALYAPMAAAAEVRLRSSGVCTAPIVRLADAAEIRGDDEALIEILAAITLCPAPASGSERTFTQHDIRQILALSDVEREQVVVTGSEQVVLKGEIGSYEPRKNGSKFGNVRQALHVTEARLDRAGPAAQPAAAAASPSAKDVKQAKLVERGTAVTVHARKAGVRITTSGTALQAGAAGELINVELEPKQRVLARVVGAQQVEVGGSTLAAVPATAAPQAATNP
jgi:hypothetical protein